VAEELANHAFTNVRVLQGGFDAWRSAGYPLEAKAQAA